MRSSEVTLSYHLRHIAVATERIVAEEPWIVMETITERLSVGRHTVTRALRLHLGCSFRSLKAESVRSRSLELLTGADVASVKEIAHRLGYQSPSAFGKRIKILCGHSPKTLRATIPERASR